MGLYYLKKSVLGFEIIVFNVWIMEGFSVFLNWYEKSKIFIIYVKKFFIFKYNMGFVCYYVYRFCFLKKIIKLNYLLVEFNWNRLRYIFLF